MKRLLLGLIVGFVGAVLYLDLPMTTDHSMDMSMEEMAASLEGKKGDEFDQAFIKGMIPHHEGAIDMAEQALMNAKHDEIKAMARAIISAQQKEIDQMNRWIQEWGYTK